MAVVAKPTPAPARPASERLRGASDLSGQDQLQTRLVTPANNLRTIALHQIALQRHA